MTHELRKPIAGKTLPWAALLFGIAVGGTLIVHSYAMACGALTSAWLSWLYYLVPLWPC